MRNGGEIVRVEDLVKVFRTQRTGEGLRGALVGLLKRETVEKTAVDHISFSVEERELVGYIGPNGAGKSTTIKMLTGILKPTSGHIRVAGFDPYFQRRQYVRNIGVVFGQRTQLWWDLAVIESFRLLGHIYEVPKTDFDRRLGELTELLELGEFLHTPVRKLSLGQRMRCDLTAALLHGPRLLFLDEPTVGLDVVARLRVREFLGEINRRDNVTILLTTHDLDEIEKLCERIVIIDHGRKVFDGLLAELIAKFAPQKKLVVDFATVPAAAELEAMAARGLECRKVEEHRFEFTFDRRQTSAGQAIEAVASLGGIRDVTIEEAGIEEVVRDIYARGAV